MHGVRSLPTNSTTSTLGCSTVAACEILSTQSHNAVPPQARTSSVLRRYGDACSRRLSPYMSTGPRSREPIDDLDDAPGVDDGDVTNHTYAANPMTMPSARSTRFIEGNPNRVEWRGRRGSRIDTGCSPGELLRPLEAPDREGEHRHPEREDDQHLGPDR